MVEKKELGSLLNYEQPTPYLVKSTEYDDSFGVPVLTAGQSLLLGYTDETTGIYRASKDNPTIIFDDFTTSFHWIDYDFKVKSSAMKMLRPKRRDVNFRYIYYSMCGIGFVPSGHQRHWISKYSHFQIPIPSLSEQTRIVGILDTFTAAIGNLKQQIAERMKQYEHYRDELLDLEGKEGVETKMIEEITKRNKGIPITAEQMSELASINGNIRVFAAGATLADIDEDDLPKNCAHRLPSVIVKSRGHVDFEFYEKPFTHKNEMWSYSFESKEKAKYLYYFLKTKTDYFRNKAKTNSVKLPQLCVADTDKYKVPVPSPEEQNRIVSILDTFEASIANLEAQLKEREKQYEYYRNKLLTFD